MTSRRALDNTSESTNSTYSHTSSLRENIDLANTLSKLLDDAQDEDVSVKYGVSEPSPSALCRLLSLRSVCSTTSSFATLHQSMRDQPASFRKIGFGQCGIIYEQPSRGYVIKLARKFFEASLLGDLHAHLRIYQALADYPTDCRIPSVHKYITASNSSWWDANGHFFTRQDDFKLPTMALVTQRIMPLPKIVRTTLIDLYCPEEHTAAAKQNPTNRDCLARIYLGRSRLPDAPKSANFTLRNFNLHLDQMIALNLPVSDYANTIGEALAVIHWAANVDAYDVEFVLGSEAEAIYLPEPTKMPQVRLKAGEVESIGSHTDLDEILSVDFKQRPTRLWVLDFNLCSRWDMTGVLSSGNEKELVEMLVHAFINNDPYYPRPVDSGRALGINLTYEEQVRHELWKTFSSAYLDRSKIILYSSPLEGDQKERLLKLPETFIISCIAEAQNSH